LDAVAGGYENIRDLDCGYGFGKADKARQATTGGTAGISLPARPLVMLVSGSSVREPCAMSQQKSLNPVVGGRAIVISKSS
jgi:hypothetical protein